MLYVPQDKQDYLDVLFVSFRPPSLLLLILFKLKFDRIYQVSLKLRPGKQDYWDILFVSFRLPAIASRSGEAGGEETDKNQSPSARRKLNL